MWKERASEENEVVIEKLSEACERFISNHHQLISRPPEITDEVSKKMSASQPKIYHRSIYSQCVHSKARSTLLSHSHLTYSNQFCMIKLPFILTNKLNAELQRKLLEAYTMCCTEKKCMKEMGNSLNVQLILKQGR